MKRAIGLLLCLAFVSVAICGDEKKPVKKKGDKAAQATKVDKDKSGKDANKAVKILKKVDEACKAVKAVQYDITIDGEGAISSRVGNFEGTVSATGIISGDGGRPAPEKYAIDGRFTAPGSTETRHITGGSDGENFYVINHQDKKAYEDIDPAVLGSSERVLMTGIMIEFLHPKPFTDEIIGRDQKLMGSKKINGVDCFEIHVVYQAEQAPEATWYFSKEDFLPRCRIDHYTLPDGQKGKMCRVISNLKVDPKLPEDTFELKLPAGYTKTDDFAP
ncbi:MAG: DUF2092 domain-containing protein [Planctomycetota bacterium]